MTVASRGVTFRDFALFQLKLAIDGLKDILVFNVSILAMAVDLLAGRGRRPRLFYSVLGASERFDAWLNLHGVVERMAVITEEAWSVPGPTPQGPPEQEGRRPVFSDFTNAGYWLPAYEAQNDAMDGHMEKYDLQDEDWRPGMMEMIKSSQAQ